VGALKAGPLVATRKVLARLRHRGAGEAAGVALERIRDWIGSADTLIFLARPAEGDFPEPRHDPELELVEATVAHGEIYEDLIGTDSATTFRLRVEAGSRCFFVRDGGSFVHSTWLTEKAAWTRELRRYFCPPPGDAYVYESFTRPEARGLGVYPFALTEICNRLATEKKGLVWVGVEEDNPPSRKAISKAGFEEQFRVRYARKLGFLRVDEPIGDGVKLCIGCLAQNLKKMGRGA
jgi:ribosomal protein S18 acetylase RimI-like enzyme